MALLAPQHARGAASLMAESPSGVWGIVHALHKARSFLQCGHSASHKSSRKTSSDFEMCEHEEQPGSFPLPRSNATKSYLKQTCVNGPQALVAKGDGGRIRLSAFVNACMYDAFCELQKRANKKIRNLASEWCKAINAHQRCIAAVMLVRRVGHLSKQCC